MRTNQFTYNGMEFSTLHQKHGQVALVNTTGIFGLYTQYRNTNVNVPDIKRLEIPTVAIDSRGNRFDVVEIKKGCLENLKETEDIVIPYSVTNLEWSFWHCKALRAIHVSKENPTYCDHNGVLFTKDMKTLIAYPNLHGKEFIVPEGVTEIATCAFKDSNIERLKLPATLMKIRINAFYRCTKLTDVLGILNNKIFYEGFYGSYGNVNPNFHIGDTVVKLSEIEKGIIKVL